MCMALALAACLPESEDDESSVDAASSVVSLSIAAPTAMSSMDTTDETVRVSGTASSDAGVFAVSWSNDTGGEGTAAGTESWDTGDIVLALGDNRITITAEDTAGETAAETITVNRESGEVRSASLSWTPPDARTDGTPLTNLAGFKIYYGRMSGVYDHEIDVDNPSISTYLVEGLNSGDWYFAVAAYDAEGLESEPSDEVLREIS